MSTFIVGIALSGLLQTCEVEHLWHEHPDREDLRDLIVLKWIFLGFAVLCGGSFWTLYTVCDGDATRSLQCYKITTASAILEWSACCLTTGYVVTLIYDVWPAYRHAPIQQPAWADKSGIRGIYLANGTTYEIPRPTLAIPGTKRPKVPVVDSDSLDSLSDTAPSQRARTR
ncbi:hypothetical protein T439DRAFT_326436 [Meredithblackwellia eburnea MCA 4105]